MQFEQRLGSVKAALRKIETKHDETVSCFVEEIFFAMMAVVIVDSQNERSASYHTNERLKVFYGEPATQCDSG